MGVFCFLIFLSYIWFVIQREMTSEKLADEILARYEDDREYHFHQVDREWIIEAMIEFGNKINTKEK